jgi:hypothetical protein
VHEGDPVHEHAAGLGHAHFGEHQADGPEIEAEEDHDGDVSWIEWVAGDGAFASKYALAMPVKLFAGTLEVYGVSTPEPAARSHDPPGLARLPGRSPPQ